MSKIQIFSEATEIGKTGKKLTCYLVEMSLKDYIDNLPTDYNDYDIQRGIVNNIYLDSLGTDLLRGKHFPIITLISESVNKSTEEIKDFKILDGLQRTYRLSQLYKFLDELSITPAILENFENQAEFRRLYRSEWKLNKKYDYNVKEAREIIEIIKEKLDLEGEGTSVYDLKNKIFLRPQWFEIWEGLDIEDEINKMIILNAGHKAMSNYHQIELLFLNQLSYIESKHRDFKIIRGKEVSPLTYAKNRKRHEYYFSHVIEAMLSYVNKKVVTLNTALIQSIQEESDSVMRLKKDSGLIEETVEFLLELDNILLEQYGELGIKWISKDTVLSAIFASISLKEISFEQFIDILKSDKGLLNIDDFNEQRKRLDMSSINIGKYTKKLVQNGIDYLIDNKLKIDWKKVAKTEGQL